jgi:hypothetical protein
MQQCFFLVYYYVKRHFCLMYTSCSHYLLVARKIFFNHGNYNKIHLIPVLINFKPPLRIFLNLFSKIFDFFNCSLLLLHIFRDVCLQPREGVKVLQIWTTCAKFASVLQHHHSVKFFHACFTKSSRGARNCITSETFKRRIRK